MSPPAAKTPLTVYTIRPNGGVSKPASIANIPNIANAYGFISGPINCIKSGTVNKIIDIESSNIPKISQIITIIKRTIISLRPTEFIDATINESISDKDRNLEYIPAVINKIIIGAEILPASITDATIPFHFIPLNNAIKKLAKAPTPAASVAVKIPPQIPPKLK